MGSPRRPEGNRVPFCPWDALADLSVVNGVPAPDCEDRHQVDGRKLATQLRTSYIDDEGRRAGR
jgi:hypothetical protein